MTFITSDGMKEDNSSVSTVKIKIAQHTVSINPDYSALFDFPPFVVGHAAVGTVVLILQGPQEGDHLFTVFIRFFRVIQSEN